MWVVTDSFMFPWEKRQMGGEGTPLRWWEKVYWWVFAGGAAYLLLTMGKRWRKDEQKEEVAQKTARSSRPKTVVQLRLCLQ